MNVLEAISGRFSARAYLDRPVAKETIIKILDIARHAPSGVNTQPWQVIVAGPAARSKLAQAIIAAREAGIAENPDYHYYPENWRPPYRERRKECGLALYSALGIAKDEAEKRKAAWYRNYYFFYAPIGLIFVIDSDLDKGSWLDMGGFIENVMLAARGLGLETCPQASMAEYPDIVREIVNLPHSKHIVCGMAMGYADPNATVNQYRTSRIAVEDFTSWVE